MNGGVKNKKKDSKRIYFFGEGNKELSDLLGGKGANLNEIVNIGIPVPPGFTITTPVCKEYIKNGKLTEDVQEQVKTAISKLERQVNKEFGGNNPLILSVRSGAKISMPGMLDTILNLGLNDKTAKHLAEQTNKTFAYDCYKRLVQKFAELVFDIPSEPLKKYLNNSKEILDHDREFILKRILNNPEIKQRLEKEIAYENYEYLKKDPKKTKTVEDYLEPYYDVKTPLNYTLKNFLSSYLSCELSAEKKKHELETELIKNYTEKTYGKEFPQDVNEQLMLAIKSVFKSWNNKRAKEYRKMNNIPEDLGTAVNIQLMVFGNKGKNSSTGVVFTRSPIDGKEGLYGEYLINAQGEELVSGLKTPKPIKKLKEQNPKLYRQLAFTAKKLEGHFKEVQDIEFTIEDDKLWILQTRKGKLSSQAEVQAAVDMVKEGLITKKEAINRLNYYDINMTCQEEIDPSAKYEKIAEGIGTSSGIVSGEIVLTAKKAEELAKQGRKCILVRKETSPEDIKGIESSVGVLTQTGGSTSHATLVARAMNKCCITGCEDLRIKKDCITLGCEEYEEGDWISLNGYTGEIIEGEVKTVKKEETQNIKKIIRWSEKFVNKKIELNIDTPEEIREYVNKGEKSIGLCRTEHLFFKKDSLDLTLKYKLKNSDKNVLLKKMKEKQKTYYKQVFDSVKDNRIMIMLLNYSLNHFLSKAGYTRKKANFAGKGYSEDIKKIYIMQTKALTEAYSENKYGPKVEILIPDIVPKNKRQELKNMLEDVTSKNGNITVNPCPDKTYFIENIKHASYEKIRNADTVITKPKYLDLTKIILAQYAIREQDELKK